MIRIFGLRILTGKDIGIINDNYDSIKLKIEEIEEKHKRLSEYVIAIDDLIDLLADQQVADSKPVKKTKKTKK